MAEDMPERHDHGSNLVGTVAIENFRQITDFADVRGFGEAQQLRSGASQL